MSWYLNDQISIILKILGNNFKQEVYDHLYVCVLNLQFVEEKIEI